MFKKNVIHLCYKTENALYHQFPLYGSSLSCHRYVKEKYFRKNNQ